MVESKLQQFSKFLLFYSLFTVGIVQSNAQTTHTIAFEATPEDASTFSSNSQVFTITGNNFDIAKATNTGWNGTSADSRYIDNSGPNNTGNGVSLTIKSNDGTDFSVEQFYVFATTWALNFNHGQTLTIVGKRDGSNVYTITKSSGFTTSFGTNNGFTLVDFSTEESTDYSDDLVDEIVISAPTGLDYMALDAFTWKTAPSATVPSITTAAASSITAITALLGGNVTDDGGASITERGIVWSSSDTDPRIGEAGVIKDAQGGTATGVFSETISALPANTTVYYNAYAINSEGTSYGAVTSFTTSEASFALNVMLEGPFNSGSMTTTLNTNGALPAAQPYSSSSAESSSGIPATAVDWIEVELRTGTASGTKVGSRAAFVLSNGSVVDKDGNTLTIPSADGSDYYIVIYHRNHLSIMSSGAVSISSGTYTHNFTTGQGQAIGSAPMIEVSSGVFAMYSGDVDANGTVDGMDLTTWRSQNGAEYDYTNNGKSDLNLDGVINAVDRNDHQQKNSGKTSDVSG